MPQGLVTYPRSLDFGDDGEFIEAHDPVFGPHLFAPVIVDHPARRFGLGQRAMHFGRAILLNLGMGRSKVKFEFCQRPIVIALPFSVNDIGKSTATSILRHTDPLIPNGLFLVGIRAPRPRGFRPALSTNHLIHDRSKPPGLFFMAHSRPSAAERAGFKEKWRQRACEFNRKRSVCSVHNTRALC